MDGVQFTIPAEPVPAARPRVTGRGIAFYPKKHTAYKEYLRVFLQDMPSLSASGPVQVRVKFVMPRYKTSDHPVHRSDIDNLSKLPLDSMTKVEDGSMPKFWVDDDLIVHLTAFKRFARDGEDPHTEIRATVIMEPVEDYVDREFAK
jgi:Holliday junction resolvase RusA-like endonuclease